MPNNTFSLVRLWVGLYNPKFRLETDNSLMRWVDETPLDTSLLNGLTYRISANPSDHCYFLYVYSSFVELRNRKCQQSYGYVCEYDCTSGKNKI